MSSLAASPRPRLGRGRPFSAGYLVAVAAALAGSVALGALATSSPLTAGAAAAAALALAVAVTRPAWLFALGICLLAVETTRVFGAVALTGRPGTYKLILYACLIPLLLERGLVPRRCAPILAYAVLFAATESLATPLPGLSTSQTVSSFATLSLAWVVFAVHWDWRRDQRLLKLLACVPTISVALGALLSVGGVLELFRGTPVRLEGATLAATLGALAVAGVLACIVLYRIERWEAARWLGVLNVVILGASLSRGAAVALAILAAPSLLRFWRRQSRARGPSLIANVALLALLVSFGGLVLGAGLVARSKDATDYVPGRGLSHEVGSGRFEAWSVAFEQAKVNIAFGRGLGAGPIVGQTPGSPQGFTAQHNEYLRMLLEGGVLGSLLVLGAIVYALSGAIRRAAPRVRADLSAGALALAVFSFTENTLTTPAVAVAFLVVFAIAAARGTATARGA